MKSRRAKGWRCSNCNHIYPDSNFGKIRAEKCCTCRQCGEAGSYVGTDQALCKKCHTQNNWDRARENLKHAQKDYELACRSYELYMGELPSEAE